MADTTAATGQEPQAEQETASVQSDKVHDDSAANGAATSTGPDDGSKTDTDENDDLPEWARKQLKKANNEAASYRTQLREVQEQFRDAKTEAELEAILKPLEEKLDQSEARSRELERKLIIKDYGLSADMAEFITGDSPDQWEAQARKLADLAAASSSSQFERERQLRGRSGGQPNREFNAAEKAREHFAAHRD